MQEMRTPGMQKVSLATKSLADYAPVVGPDVVDELVQLARPLQGARVVHISSTAYGGAQRGAGSRVAHHFRHR